ncbi:MAG TPA: hypothetical protein VGA27_02050 [Candidatus Binatia bacterium]
MLFAVAIGFVGWNIYRSWQDGPWDLPTSAKSSKSVASSNQPAPTPLRPPINTDAIISKNLFDPERGAGATREAEENSRAFQRVRGMILLGTVIIGNDRVAILRDGNTNQPGQPVSTQSAQAMRMKVGDNLEGFRLTEIADKRVVFAKDASRVEVLLDYFRKADVNVAPPRVVAPGQVQAPPAAVPVPRVIPNLPRRGRVPTPGSPNSES